LDRGYDEITDGGDVLVSLAKEQHKIRGTYATPIELYPDGILPLVCAELACDCGGDGVRWNVP
jgi:hypothetical protein